MSIRTLSAISARAPWLRALLLALFIATPSVSNAFHFPWDQGHDTTDWDDPDDPGPCEGPECDECSTRSPVYVPTGHFLWKETDISIDGSPGLSLTRSYNSNDPRDGMFGRGWSSNCDHALLQYVGSQFGNAGDVARVTGYVFRAANGKRYTFRQNASGAMIAPTGRFERVEATADGGVRLLSPHGGSRSFDSAGRLIATTSSTGASLLYEYATDGRLRRMVAAGGRSLTFSYNTRGRVESVTDHTSRVWTYGYDPRGNLVSVTDPSGGIRQYEYREFTPVGDGQIYSQLITVRDATGVIETSVVYNNTRVSSYTSAANRFTYAYNVAARTVTKTDAVGSQWVFVYDSAGRITSERDPLGRTKHHEYDANGKRTRFVDAANRSWTWTYDSLGRMTSATNPLQVQTTWGYEGANPFARRINMPAGRSVEYAYDLRYLPTRIVDSGGAATTYVWNDAGHLVRTQDALGGRLDVTVDAVGRPATITDAIGRTVTIGHDPLGQVIAAANSNSQSTAFEYDGLGRVSAQISATGARTSYTYDSAGRVTSVTDAGGLVMRFEFDAHGRTSTHVLSDGRRIEYRYRSDNLVHEKIRPDGSIERYQYDAAKRLTEIATGGNVVRYTYDERGALLTATNAVSTIIRTFDAVGRLSTETVNGRTVGYTYNDADEVVAVTTPLGVTSYVRNARGSIASMTTPEGEYRFDYDVLGRRTTLTYPNGQSASYDYDAAHQLTRLTYTGAFSAAFEYDYDAAGRLETESVFDGVWSYSYDGNGRLRRAVHGTADLPYQYDGSGNILAAGRTYDDGNRLTGSATHTFSYDASGNLVLKQDRTTGARAVYRWNEFMELIGVDRYPDATATAPSSSVAFTYDALRRRLTRSVNGSTEIFVYDRTNRIGSLNGSGGLLERITHGYRADEPLAIADASGNQRFLYADRLGSIVAVSNGAVLLRAGYLPYGQSMTALGIEVPFRFTGREYEADDLYYYRARYYDPEVGRFLNEDPIGAGGGLNLYAYVEGDPVNYKDPSGKIAPAIGLGVRIIGGRAAGAAIGAGLRRLIGPTAGTIVACVLVGACSASEEAEEPAPTPEAPPADTPGDTPAPVCPVPLPDDPAQNPWPDVGEWRGQQPAGGDRGAWVNPETGEQLHPDLGHKPPIGPHWDYQDPTGDWWRVDPGTGVMTPK